MSSLTASTLLAMAPPSGQQQAPLWANLVPLILLFIVFYVVLIRPQQKKAKEHALLVQSVRAGDRIVTTAGIVAQVVTVKEKTITIRSGDAKMEITRSAIAEITERSGESSAS